MFQSVPHRVLLACSVSAVWAVQTPAWESALRTPWHFGFLHGERWKCFTPAEGWKCSELLAAPAGQRELWWEGMGSVWENEVQKSV